MIYRPSTQSVFILICVLSLLFVSGLLVVLRSKDMNKQPSISTQGLEAIGLTLELAYPRESWQELIFTNNGEHQVIAALIHYEFTNVDGQKAFARDVIWDPKVSQETDPTRLKELVSRYQVIPAGSQWLVGVGVERVRLNNRKPSFEESRMHVYQSLPPTKPVEQIHISLDAVIIEDGQIIGPQKENIRHWINVVADKFREEN
jgi:hypothetical protein